MFLNFSLFQTYEQYNLNSSLPTRRVQSARNKRVKRRGGLDSRILHPEQDTHYCLAAMPTFSIDLARYCLYATGIIVSVRSFYTYTINHVHTYCSLAVDISGLMSEPLRLSIAKVCFVQRCVCVCVVVCAVKCVHTERISGVSQ